MSSAFSQLRKATPQKPTPALRVVQLQPSAFASDWPEKPVVAVSVGLRLISDADVETARAEAARRALDLHDQDGDEDNQADAFKDALLSWIVARGTCKPSNILLPWFSHEDVPRDALTPAGKLYLYEALERLTVEESPLSRAATDEEIAGMPIATTLAAATPGSALRFRRLIAHAIDTLSV